MLQAVVQQTKRRCVEIMRDGGILFRGVDEFGIPVEIRVTLVEKSGKKARLVLEAPEEIRIEQF